MRTSRAAGVCLFAVVLGCTGQAQAQNGCLSGRAAVNTAQGAVVGGILGALAGASMGNTRDRGRNAGTGALIGGLLGGAVGCWTAHEQAIAAAREDRLNQSSAQLEQNAENLHALNVELAQKVYQLRADIESSRRSQDQYADSNDSLVSRLADEQRHSRELLPWVDDTIGQVERRKYQHSPGDEQFAIMQRQEQELLGVRSSLQQILNFSI